MNREHAIMLKAVGDVLRERLAKVQPGAQQITLPAQRVEFPAPIVKNEITTPEPQVVVTNQVPAPEVTVQVDLQPVADAMRVFFEHVQELARGIALLAEQQQALIKALSQRPAIEFKPVVQVPKATIKVEPQIILPELTVTAQLPPREKRSVRIRHEDGSESTVEEA